MRFIIATLVVLVVAVASVAAAFESAKDCKNIEPYLRECDECCNQFELIALTTRISQSHCKCLTKEQFNKRQKDPAGCQEYRAYTNACKECCSSFDFGASAGRYMLIPQQWEQLCKCL